MKISYLSRSIAAVIALIICSGLALTGNMANKLPVDQPEPEQQQSKKVDDRLLTASSKFTFKLYEQAVKQRDHKNLFISPTSVMFALAMTYNGAEGETRRAMADALGLTGMRPGRRKSCCCRSNVCT